MRTVLTIFLFLIHLSADSQVVQRRNNVQSGGAVRGMPTEQSKRALSETVLALESGLRASSTGPFADRLAPSVQVGLPNLGRGQYSANQANQLIAGFLKQRPVRSFVVDHVESAVAAPYVYGSIVLSGGVGQDTLRLYVAFVMNESRWAISHFSLY